MLKDESEAIGMKRFLMLFQVALFLILTVSLAGAVTITVAPESTVVVDGNHYTLVTPPGGGGLMWEGNKACLCAMTAFRALQAFGTFLSLSEFDSHQISITTGWNTHGPEELFVDKMTWVAGVNFAYADPITASPQLTLQDAWYNFTYQGNIYRVDSHYNNYRFSPVSSAPGYVAGWDFFAYRTAVQTGTATPAQRNYFRDIIRPQIVANLEGQTWFDVAVTPVPLPGTVWLLVAGLAKVVGLRLRTKA